jgi:hypothetical protein
MPKTIKIQCNCGWSVTVENDISWKIAEMSSDIHIEENQDHIIYGTQTVWTNNPYIPPDPE